MARTEVEKIRGRSGRVREARMGIGGKAWVISVNDGRVGRRSMVGGCPGCMSSSCEEGVVRGFARWMFAVKSPP